MPFYVYLIYMFIFGTSALNICDDCTSVTGCTAARDRVLYDNSYVAAALISSARCGSRESDGNVVKVSKMFKIDSLVEQDEDDHYQISLWHDAPSHTHARIYADDTDNHTNLKLLPQDCGKINEDRIISDKTQFEELPWMTLIIINNQNNHNKVLFGCSGTLINSRYVLTVGHCAKIATSVRVGEYDITTTNDCEGEGEELTCASPHQDIEIEEIIIYPEYNQGTFTDDIALLRLKEPVNFENPNVGAICLPTTSNLRNRDLSKVQGTLAGWRLLQNPSALKKSKGTIYSDEDCKKLHSELFRGRNKPMPTNKLCVEGFRNLESGAPLMIKSPFQDYNRYAQYGILSSGPVNSATGIFTDVSKYMQWILDTIKP